LEKTPLKRKRPVVKSDGQVVYSKFDFISEDKRGQSSMGKEKRGKAKPTDLLKKAENYESKIARLETQGKKEDAVIVAEGRKWDTALKRAEGEKIRDDPFLLKKTIKKQDQLKQASRKKWQERIEHVDHQKKQRVDKRNTNIQARKDDKKKRSIKLQRKKGRML
jgi:acetyl-CoA carboxylase beta subunit